MSRLLEFKELFHQVKLAWIRNEETVLVILVDAKGSAYRLPGTKMIMTSAGNMYGTISGGCLEADLYEWAKVVFDTKTPLTHRYDLSEKEIWSLGIGCKGDLEFIFLPINPQNTTWLEIGQLLQKEQPFTLIVDMNNGKIAPFDHKGNNLSNHIDFPIEIIEKALQEFSIQTRAQIFLTNQSRYFVDVVKESEKLIVVGAGKDAIPVANLAYKSGFAVTILDSRNQFNNKQNFPNATHIAEEIENVDSSSLIDSWWLIMNHHQDKDEKSLQLAIESRPRYIGVLGPTYRTNEMLKNIGYQLESGPIFSPVGLDLGAETIDEVAISIVSELLSIRSGKTAKSLHGKAKIHG